MTTPAAEVSVCRYCGLPLASRWRTRRGSERPAARAEDADYCCFGCRFAAAVAEEGGETGEVRWTLTRLGVAIFFSMNVMVFTMALWSRDVYRNEPSVGLQTAEALYEVLRYGCLLFAAPVVLLLGGPLLQQTRNSLRRGKISTDWLLLAGIVASLDYSIISVVTRGEHIYFEVACMVLVAVTLGRWLEATGKLKTTEAIRSLQQLLPATVRVISGTQSRQVALERVQPQDLIRVLPGERIPLDGTIVRNQALIDQQLLTGESEPVVRRTGHEVHAGSLNLDGDLLVRVTAAASAGTLQRLVDMVMQAILQKGPEERLADRLTQWFVPLVALIATATFTVYYARDSFHDALMSSLAVVLIACPCALGMATPLAVWAALGTACQRRVLFRRGDALSTLARVRAVCFDKTGTLTSGTAVVQSLEVDSQTDCDEVARRAAALASPTPHILARAIAAYVNASAPEMPERVEVVAGQGVAGKLKDRSEIACLGSLDFMRRSGLQVPASLRSALDRCLAEGQSFCCVGWDVRVRGVFQFRERLRDDVAATLRQLREDGLHVCVLTGDHPKRAAELAAQLGIETHGGLLPHDKLLAVQRLRSEHGAVLMVGDGVNDAPALAAADVGMALGCGADVSRDAADVCLLGDELQTIPWAILWARDTRRVVRQNLFWAFAYNLVGVTLAVCGRLNPIVAAIAMVGSSLFVVSNSLRLSPPSRPLDTPSGAEPSHGSFAPPSLDSSYSGHLLAR
jgi:heavy metal translocating P-type ATPase